MQHLLGIIGYFLPLWLAYLMFIKEWDAFCAAIKEQMKCKD